MKPTLSIIIVTYRSAAEIVACLGALRHAGQLGQPHTEVIVVDNNSDDGTLHAVRSAAPEARILARRENAGFAAGCNAGAHEASGDALLFLNPDAYVEPDALARLLSALDHSGVGAAGPCLWDEHGRAAHSHRPLPSPRTEFTRLWSRLARALGLSAAARRDSSEDVEWLCGACLLVRRAAWIDVGPLDEGFFLYFEETDWCRRALARGWRLRHVAQASVRHVAGASAAQSGERLRGREIAAVFGRSRRRYFRKHFGLLGIALVEVMVGARDTVDFLRRATR